MYIIVTTNEKIAQNAKLFGAQVIETSNNERNLITNKKTISEILQGFAFTPKFKGYHYLKSILEECMADKKYYMSSITQVIYPDIAKKFNVSVICVEKNIRHAMSMSFKAAQECYELLYARKLTKVPTNKSFITMISENLNKNT